MDSCLREMCARMRACLELCRHEAQLYQLDTVKLDWSHFSSEIDVFSSINIVHDGLYGVHDL